MAESKRAETAGALTELMRELGRVPTAKEIAARAGVDLSTVYKHLRRDGASRKHYDTTEDTTSGMLVVGLPEDPP